MRVSPASKAAYAAIIMFGIVSLLGDIVYEGARGLIPDYLYFLGATALVVGLVSGFGELLGYVMRLVSGQVADRTQAYWVFMFLGYGLIIAIPLLGITSTWQAAVMLVVLERIGKGIRAPSRDTLVSIASKNIGPGKAFGLHELLDQTGAVLGPIIVAAAMFYTFNDYQFSFSFLWLPFLLLMIVLVLARLRTATLTAPKQEEAMNEEVPQGTAKGFRIYTLAVFLNTMGLIPASLILFQASSLLQPVDMGWFVPIIYVIIQAVDAVVAPFAGYSFDKYGIRIMAAPFVLSILPSIFAAMATGIEYVILAAVSFGVVLGMQESTYRAAVTQFAPIRSRGRAYGIFNTAYGVAFLISGSIYGLLLDLHVPLVLVLVFVIVIQTLAIVALSKASGVPHRESQTQQLA